MADADGIAQWSKATQVRVHMIPMDVIEQVLTDQTDRRFLARDKQSQVEMRKKLNRTTRQFTLFSRDDDLCC